MQYVRQFKNMDLDSFRTAGMQKEKKKDISFLNLQ